MNEALSLRTLVLNCFSTGQTAQGLNSSPGWDSAIPSHGPQLGLPGEGAAASLPACCLLEVIQLFVALCAVSGGGVGAMCCKFELRRLALSPIEILSKQCLSFPVRIMPLPNLRGKLRPYLGSGPLVKAL